MPETTTPASAPKSSTLITGRGTKKEEASKKSVSSSVVGITEVTGVELTYAVGDYELLEGVVTVGLNIKQAKKLYKELGELLEVNSKMQ